MMTCDLVPLVIRPFVLGAAAGAALLGVGWMGGVVRAGEAEDPLWQVAQSFRRPDALPAVIADTPNAARIVLGEALFSDRRLSRDGSLSCSSCHDPALGFTDGVARGVGIAKVRLARNTPHLWNLAWGESFFWDGRAASLEEQARGPIENPLEMAQDLVIASRAIATDLTARRLFAEAFPGEQGPAPDQILRALAAYERTLVSPSTRFDRWVAGERDALVAGEREGFGLFVGKAGCAACHSGWAFTDRAYHDIGLPGEDRGRAAVIGLAATEHAFRTPSLRELAWTGPYMHDGSLATLDAVLDHYEHGIVARPSLSPDLPRVTLSPEEREALLAFLATLSSDDPPTAASLAPASVVPASVAAAAALPDSGAAGIVSQKDKTFLPGRLSLRRGAEILIVNDDKRTHNVRIDGAGAFDSGAQEPGQTVRLSFPRAGMFKVYCGIHPSMQLTVAVTD
jgi:cytochrome c peroxidase